ncbi:winged helix-turn-helix domain-containing protein [Streptomyces evansiae]|uniref:winged helix-turn-helix domain-containing protein n=1 Tax=Streptomyces evansiae TaxID=3075535 RepID=UPI00288388CB|nr:winged helix-turn-helix domain-containing protein [Streptomyces sp. DSM 41859]MDT0423550.1 winged helix-turn-helix domain-containing protein [Streptomyces sp. DSM 41859]
MPEGAGASSQEAAPPPGGPSRGLVAFDQGALAQDSRARASPSAGGHRLAPKIEHVIESVYGARPCPTACRSAVEHLRRSLDGEYQRRHPAATPPHPRVGRATGCHRVEYATARAALPLPMSADGPLVTTEPGESRALVLASIRSWIGKYGERPPVRDLSRVTGLALGTVSHHLRRLERDGTVMRTSSRRLVPPLSAARAMPRPLNSGELLAQMEYSGRPGDWVPCRITGGAAGGRAEGVPTACGRAAWSWWARRWRWRLSFSGGSRRGWRRRRRWAPDASRRRASRWCARSQRRRLRGPTVAEGAPGSERVRAEVAVAPPRPGPDAGSADRDAFLPGVVRGDHGGA